MKSRQVLVLYSWISYIFCLQRSLVRFLRLTASLVPWHILMVVKSMWREWWLMCLGLRIITSRWRKWIAEVPSKLRSGLEIKRRYFGRKGTSKIAVHRNLILGTLEQTQALRMCSTSLCKLGVLYDSRSPMRCMLSSYHYLFGCDKHISFFHYRLPFPCVSG